MHKNRHVATACIRTCPMLTVPLCRIAASQSAGREKKERKKRHEYNDCAASAIKVASACAGVRMCVCMCVAINSNLFRSQSEESNANTAAHAFGAAISPLES